jgi:hypothetical protein
LTRPLDAAGRGQAAAAHHPMAIAQLLPHR